MEPQTDGPSTTSSGPTPCSTSCREGCRSTGSSRWPTIGRKSTSTTSTRTHRPRRRAPGSRRTSNSATGSSRKTSRSASSSSSVSVRGRTGSSGSPSNGSLECITSRICCVPPTPAPPRAAPRRQRSRVMGKHPHRATRHSQFPANSGAKERAGIFRMPALSKQPRNRISDTGS